MDEHKNMRPLAMDEDDYLRRELTSEEPADEVEVAPMTNADWIRSMSDVELGEFMMYDHPCDEKAGVRCTGSRCDECIRNWLREEHKEAET
jgi:hypothetical protein